jgi:isopentenyldiphosphate isomerase
MPTTKTKPTEPKFVPKPGQVDYTNVRWVPVINCVVRHNGKVLLVKRSKKLRLYPGVWHGISGFLDDHQDLKDKVLEELREELGMPESKVTSITLGQILEQDAKQYQKTWIVHPVLVEVATEKVKLDWEADSYKWVSPEAALTMDLLPGYEQVLKLLLKLH